MHDVFISYKAEEFGQADTLRAALAVAGISCWMAPNSIPHGSNYAIEIDKAISDCEVLVLILSSKAQDSIWIPKEIDLALNYGKIVIPFAIENCPLRGAFKFYLTNVQRLNAYEDSQSATDELIRMIEGLIGPKTEKRAKPEKTFDDHLADFPALKRRETPSDDDTKEKAEILCNKFESLRIKIKKIEYTRGAAVTRFEVYPAEDVKISKIISSQSDIELALGRRIRIEAPIPGKPAIGIEIPNKKPHVVELGSMINSEEFEKSKAKLPICIGKDVEGRSVIIDLAKMPHLLIGGQSGSGKSICLNSIVTSLISKLSPDEVKFVLIDTKKIEMAIYRDMPHLYRPVITDLSEAANALEAMVEEMERRYSLLESACVRDLDSYNDRLAKDSPGASPLPRIVIVIDDLHDLMFTVRDRAEMAIMRIAQKARAAGIHIVVSTMRVTVDVISGLIKANIPSRISFSVASMIESRILLDCSGAEKLSRGGDMLFLPVGSMSPTRLQGAFIHDREVICIVDRLKSKYAPPKEPKADLNADPEPLADKHKELMLFYDIVKFAVSRGELTTSAVQRNFNLGFGRSAKIIDRMEELGFITSFKQGRPREVLITESQLKLMQKRNDRTLFGILPNDKTAVPRVPKEDTEPEIVPFDEAFLDALKLSAASRRVTISYLQRNLQISFGRAVKILDRMKELGFITSADSPNPRTMLITPGQLEGMIASGDRRVYGLLPEE